MAFVAVEFYAITRDPRYDRLAKLCAFADRDHARGKMEHIWLECTEKGTTDLPIWVIDTILGHGGAAHLVEAGLAEFEAPKNHNPPGLLRVISGEYQVPETTRIRIKGANGRTEYLARNRENGVFGKMGGRPRKTRNNPPGFPGLFSETQDNNAELNTNWDAKKNNPGNPSYSYSSKSIGRIVKPRKKSEKMGGGGSSPDAQSAGNPPPFASQFSGSTLPADWQPSDHNVALAATLALPVAAQARKFAANAQSKGRVAVDWQADFALWLEGSYQQTRYDKSTATTDKTIARRGPKKLT